MIPAILAFIPALVIGLLVVLLAWPGRYQDQFFFKLSLAAGLGPGIVSCLYFGFSLFLRPRNRLYFGLEGAVLAALIVAVFVLRRQKSSWMPTPPPPRPSWISWLLLAALVGVFFISSASFTMQSLMQPHGIQDAWNIWNMRARFLFRGAADWKVLFSPAIYWLNHPDYPFLVSAGSARAWNIVGNESTAVPILQAALYSLGLASLLFSALRQNRSTGQAALATLLLVASPWFILFGAWQIADVPLDFYITASLILLVMNIGLPAPSRPGFLFLLGLSGGLAAWTKNEGILFLVILLFVWLLARLNRRTPLLALVKQFIWIVAGLIFPLINLAYLKTFLAPSSDLFAGQSSTSILPRLLDLSRYTLTLSYLGKSIANFSQWSIPLFPLLAILLILFWPSRLKANKVLLYPALALLLLASGYFGIYLITPHDLVWHLRTSTDRLVFHLFPPLLWIIFMATRSPEEIVETIATGKDNIPSL